VDPFGKAGFSNRSYFDVDIDTGHLRSHVIIKFQSGWKNGCPSCKNVKLAQIGQNIYENLLDNWIHSDAWFLDAYDWSAPWYPWQYPQFGSTSMTDYPGLYWTSYLDPGTDIYGATQNFETCAYCADDKKAGLVELGCVVWGHSVGGLRTSSHWGAGRGITPVPPSLLFQQLFMGLDLIDE
jgi:hypothetical protein